MSLSKKMVCVPYNEVLYKIKWTLPAYVNMNAFPKMAEREPQYETAYVKLQNRPNYTYFRDTISVNVLPEKQNQYI